MRVLLVVFFCLIFTANVYAAELFKESWSATFEEGTAGLSGSGSVTGSSIQKPYLITAQMRAGDVKESRLRISTDSEVISLILTHGKIYDEQWAEQKVSKLFAKLVSLGLLDIFLLIEILDGGRDELYLPYIVQGPDNILLLKLSPAESLALYEQWTSDLRGLLGAAADGMSAQELSIAEGFMRQIFTALEADVQYSFHIQPETKRITQIGIQSQISAPDERLCQASIQVLSPGQLPSS